VRVVAVRATVTVRATSKRPPLDNALRDFQALRQIPVNILDIPPKRLKSSIM
jgi:hypothetical protein